jgi:hypothetical protein
MQHIYAILCDEIMGTREKMQELAKNAGTCENLGLKKRGKK